MKTIPYLSKVFSLPCLEPWYSSSITRITARATGTPLQQSFPKFRLPSQVLRPWVVSRLLVIVGHGVFYTSPPPTSPKPRFIIHQVPRKDSKASGFSYSMQFALCRWLWRGSWKAGALTNPSKETRDSLWHKQILVQLVLILPLATFPFQLLSTHLRCLLQCW
jgi:hypothetical protein